jgi:hypothetical protein
MKLASTILAVGLAAWLPSAQAQAPSCKIYEDLSAAAPSRFETYRGVEQAPGIYAAKLRPAQFPNCAVISQTEAALICYGGLGPEGVARMAYNAELRRMRTCLGGWTTKPPLETDDPQIEMVDGARFIRETPAGELTFGVALGREKIGARRYRVGFALLWKPLRTGV